MDKAIRKAEKAIQDKTKKEFAELLRKDVKNDRKEKKLQEKLRKM